MLLMLVCVLVNTAIIMFGCDMNTGEKMFSVTDLAIMYTCEIILYIIQVLAITAGFFILIALNRASKAKPTCVSKKCDEDKTELKAISGKDDDMYLCDECTQLVKILKPGIKKLVCAFAGLLTNQICQFIIYTS